MGHSGRERHRDREPGRAFDDDAAAPPDRVFRITDEQRQQIAQSLRYIDDARRAIERQMNPDNREIIRELRASADAVFEVLNELDEIDEIAAPRGRSSD